MTEPNSPLAPVEPNSWYESKRHQPSFRPLVGDEGLGVYLSDFASGEHVDLLQTASNWLSHPLAQQFLTKITASTPIPPVIVSAADVLGERLCICANALAALTDNQLATNLNPQAALETRGDILTKMLTRGLVCEPYYWDDAIVDAIATTDVPEHVFSRSALNGKSAMWWTYRVARNIGTDEEPIDIDCILLLDYGSHFQEWTLGAGIVDDSGIRKNFFTGHTYKYGTQVPRTSLQDTPQPGIPAGTSAALAFLASPFIPKDTQRIRRQERRRIARAGIRTAQETCTFITLRRPRTEAPTEAEDGEEKRYIHRWIVSGHFRNQWYPRDEAHRLIWIAPHIKGPDGAPMIKHVFRVAR